MALTTVPSTMFTAGQTPAFNGISFPATQSASSDANTLDDYEEGTFTFTDGSGAGLSITTIFAKYTKIGRQVNIIFQIVFPTTANTNAIQLAGLPFITANYSSGVFGYNDSSSADRSFLIQNGVNYIQIRNPASNRTNANYSGTEIHGQATYYV